MTEVRFTEQTLHEIANANFANIARASVDIDSVSAVLDGIDESLPCLGEISGMQYRAAALRAQVNSLVAAAGVLSAVASSFETLAHVSSRSLRALPTTEMPPAKVAKKATRRKP
jgi:hypothetical protein